MLYRAQVGQSQLGGRGLPWPPLMDHQTKQQWLPRLLRCCNILRIHKHLKEENTGPRHPQRAMYHLDHLHQVCFPLHAFLQLTFSWQPHMKPQPAPPPATVSTIFAPSSTNLLPQKAYPPSALGLPPRLHRTKLKQEAAP